MIDPAPALVREILVALAVRHFLLLVHQFGATLYAFGAGPALSPLAEKDGSVRYFRARFIANSDHQRLHRGMDSSGHASCDRDCGLGSANQ
jgi:hypothetical protein